MESPESTEEPVAELDAPDVVCVADEDASDVACDAGGDVSAGDEEELDVAGALVDSELDDDDDCFVGCAPPLVSTGRYWM